MGKLEKLRLFNFQCHSKLDIEFDKHVTSIVGPSDVGKSAVIRALRWLVTNKPTGDAFVKDGTKSVSVGLQLDGGEVIVRKRSITKNIYKQNKKEFKSFGTDVPESISKSLNLDAINFSQQHDSPFWFSSTPGQVSRELNAIVNLDVIDSTMKNIATELRRIKIEKSACDNRLKIAEEEKDGLEYVDELSSDFNRLKRKETKADNKASEAVRSAFLYSEARTHLRTLKTSKLAYSEGLEVIKWGQAYRKKHSQLDSLMSMVSRAEEAEEIVSIEIPSLSKVEEMEILWKQVIKKREDRITLLGLLMEMNEYQGKLKVPSIKEVEVLEEIHHQLQEKLRSRNYLLTTIAKMIERENWLTSKKEELLEAKNQMEEKMEGICPMCGNEIEKDLLHDIG